MLALNTLLCIPIACCMAAQMDQPVAYETVYARGPTRLALPARTRRPCVRLAACAPGGCLPTPRKPRAESAAAPTSLRAQVSPDGVSPPRAYRRPVWGVSGGWGGWGGWGPSPGRDYYAPGYAPSSVPPGAAAGGGFVRVPREGGPYVLVSEDVFADPSPPVTGQPAATVTGTPAAADGASSSSAGVSEGKKEA